MILILLAACEKQPEKCSVAVEGHNAVIDIEGPDAFEVCESFINDGYYDDRIFYQTIEQPGREVICIIQIEKQTFVVRDQGFFFTVGNNLCSDLAHLARGG